MLLDIYGCSAASNEDRTYYMKAFIISFANQKGGVGKTTSAVNVAASLAALGKRTLLADLDPQGNSTSGVGINKKLVKNSIYEALVGLCDPRSAVMSTGFRNLSVMPAIISLAGAEFDLLQMESREYALKRALEPLRDDYDYMIIDCPPSLGLLTVNALSASDGVVIPMQCEYYALEGLSQLMITIRKVKKLYNEGLGITGILITMHNGRLNLSVQVQHELKKYYGDKLFHTVIARNVRLSEAPGFGMPIYAYDKYSKGSMAYMDVAKELVERTGM